MNDEWKADDSSRAEWRIPEEPQLETDAYHIWKPRPLLRSVRWKPVPPVAREDAAGAYDVFIDQRVFRAMHQHVWNAGPDEKPFGFLAGDLCEDPDTTRRYLIISAAIPARVPFSEDGSAQMPAEALAAMRLEVERRRGVLAGWYHRHAGGPVELTAADVATHEEHFPEPWQVALLFITDYENPTGGCFRRTLTGFDGTKALPFFEMVSNESLLAKGRRRSHLDWVNLETAESIQSEPPPRPAPPAPRLEPEPPTEPDRPPEHGVEEEIAPVAADESSLAEPEELDAAEDEFEVVLPVVEQDSSETIRIDSVTLAVESAGSDGTDLPDEGLSAIARDLDEAHAEIERAERELGIVSEEAVEEEEGSDAPTEADGSSDGALTVAEPEEGPPEGDEVLPQPGWDHTVETAEPLEPLDGVDLDSFVTEVESADVEGQVEGDEVPVRMEPDWDSAEDEMAVGEPVEPPPLAEEEPEVEDLEPTPVVVEPVPSPVRRGRGRAPRVGLMVGGVIVVAAVAVSLLMLVWSPAEEDRLESGSPAADIAITDSRPPETVLEVPTAEAADAADQVTDERMEELGESLLESISHYYGLTVAAEDGRATCAELQEAYVQVEDRWIAYNVEGKAQYRGRLPERLAMRDERLYAGVRDVEVEFGRSGCERP